MRALPNIRPPLRIDLSDPAWCPELHDGSGPAKLLAVFCANVIHIAPWRVAEGLFAGAARYLGADGRLFLYGPFKRDGKHTALSNAVFDTSLRHRDPEWGVREIEDLETGGECRRLSRSRRCRRTIWCWCSSERSNLKLTSQWLVAGHGRRARMTPISRHGRSRRLSACRPPHAQ